MVGRGLRRRGMRHCSPASAAKCTHCSPPAKVLPNRSPKVSAVFRSGLCTKGSCAPQVPPSVGPSARTAGAAHLLIARARRYCSTCYREACEGPTASPSSLISTTPSMRDCILGERRNTVACAGRITRISARPQVCRDSAASPT